MQCLIINFNRLTLPRALADWCYVYGLEPIFIDNNSDYPPLLEYYKKTKYEVLRLNTNYGHTVIWQYPVLANLGITGRFILTDPDLDLSNVPEDFLQVMENGLNKFPDYDKCGLSIEVNDLPDDDEGNLINEIEYKYWHEPLDDLYFYADTDTTFAMYRSEKVPYSHSAIRINRPYTCKHIPWYYRDYTKLPKDERYYFETALASSSSGKKRMI